MKKILFTVFAAACFLSAAYAQNTKEKEEKEALTVEVKSNGIAHTIQVGDTVHVGYGSLPSGSFMYIKSGAPATGMESQYASKSGTVTKVKYWKSLDQYQIFIKGKFGAYVVDIPQAVDKQEIIGFNNTYFNK